MISNHCQVELTMYLSTSVNLWHYLSQNISHTNRQYYDSTIYDWNHAINDMRCNIDKSTNYAYESGASPGESLKNDQETL